MLHLIHGSANDIQESSTRDEYREALRLRDRDVEPVPAEEKIESPWNVVAARRWHDEEDDRSFLALELVDRSDGTSKPLLCGARPSDVTCVL